MQVYLADCDLYFRFSLKGLSEEVGHQPLADMPRLLSPADSAIHASLCAAYRRTELERDLTTYLVEISETSYVLKQPSKFPTFKKNPTVIQLSKKICVSLSK